MDATETSELDQTASPLKDASLIAFTVAFFARSRATVFSVPIVTGETRTERQHWGESERGGEV